MWFFVGIVFVVLSRGHGIGETTRSYLWWRYIEKKKLFLVLFINKLLKKKKKL